MMAKSQVGSWEKPLPIGTFVVRISMGVFLDSTEDRDVKWHAAGFSDRVKNAEKTQTPTTMLSSRLQALHLLLKLTNLNAAIGPKRALGFG